MTNDDRRNKESFFTRFLLNYPKTSLLLAIILGVVALNAFGTFAGKNKEYSADAEVNLFTSVSGAKNYRVDGEYTITKKVTNGIFLSNQYTLNRIHWPNGNSEWMEGCTFPIGENTVICKTEDGEAYRAELHEIPKIDI